MHVDFNCPLHASCQNRVSTSLHLGLSLALCSAVIHKLQPSLVLSLVNNSSLCFLTLSSSPLSIRCPLLWHGHLIFYIYMWIYVVHCLQIHIKLFELDVKILNKFLISCFSNKTDSNFCIFFAKSTVDKDRSMDNNEIPRLIYLPIMHQADSSFFHHTPHKRWLTTTEQLDQPERVIWKQ